MLESYPEVDRSLLSKAAEKKGATLREMISDVRGYKSAHKLQPNAPIKLTLSPKAPFAGIEAYLERYLFAKVNVSKEAVKGADGLLYGGTTLYVAEDIDPAALKEKLLAEKKRLEFEVSRSEKMLNNPGFIAKAPKEKIATERAKLAENHAKLDEILSRLNEL